MIEDNVVQDWESLGKEVRLIWENAKEYNQEGSEIYEMAEKLEVCSRLIPPSYPCLISYTTFTRYITPFGTFHCSCHAPHSLQTTQVFR